MTVRRFTSCGRSLNYVKTVRNTAFQWRRILRAEITLRLRRRRGITQKEIEMKVLTMDEMNFVAGAGDDCSSGGGGNDYAGVTDTKSVGQDLVNIYEGLVDATSHIIERVANAL
jgi:hypothetical protein